MTCESVQTVSSHEKGIKNMFIRINHYFHTKLASLLTSTRAPAGLWYLWKVFEFCERQYIRTSVNVKKFNLKVPTKVNTKAGLGDKKSISAALLRLENRSLVTSPGLGSRYADCYNWRHISAGKFISFLLTLAQDENRFVCRAWDQLNIVDHISVTWGQWWVLDIRWRF